jgi:hypothetical protein
MLDLFRKRSKEMKFQNFMNFFKILLSMLIQMHIGKQGMSCLQKETAKDKAAGTIGIYF